MLISISVLGSGGGNLTIAGRFHLVDNPLVQHKLGLVRRRQTSTADFRRLTRELGLLLGYEAMRDLPVSTRRIETPLEAIETVRIRKNAVCFVSILRAGNGLLDGMLDLAPFANVGHVGIYRDHDTLEAVEYFYKVPSQLAARLVVVVDPMLATGHSAIAAIHRLKHDGAGSLRFVCLVAAPEGLRALHQAHPDVHVYAAALDRGLDENAYIVPGLGDAGDRLYGTQ